MGWKKEGGKGSEEEGRESIREEGKGTEKKGDEEGRRALMKRGERGEKGEREKFVTKFKGNICSTHTGRLGGAARDLQCVTCPSSAVLFLQGTDVTVPLQNAI